MKKDQFFAILQDIYSFYLWIECVANETHLNLYDTPIEEFADQMVRRVAENFEDSEGAIRAIRHWFWVDYCAESKKEQLWKKVSKNECEARID